MFGGDPGMNIPSRGKTIKLAIILIDIILINLSFYLAFLIKFDGQIPTANLQPYLFLLPAIGLLCFFCYWLLGLYTNTGKKLLDIVYLIFLANVIISMGTAAMAFFSRGFAFPRSILLGGILSGTLLVGTWRVLLYLFFSSFTKPKKIIIIGKAKELDLVALKFFTVPGEKYEIKGIFQAGELSHAVQALQNADAICFAGNLDERLKAEIISICLEQNKSVYLIPELYEILLHKADFQKVDDVPVFRLESLHLSFVQAFVKRTFDLIFSVIGLTFCAILFPFIALAIYLDSPGPIFYYQERVGQNGKPFKVIKFRTMIPDAEKMTGPVLATENDPRITKVGRFLRATRLDELPQLINVFRGEMSFVGPRPERQYFVEQFNELYPHYQYRLRVKPGITGLAQVLGKYDTDVADKLRYDLLYIRNYSFLLDLQLIFQTIRVVLTPEQARGCSELKPELLRKIKALKRRSKREAAPTKETV